jgi:hypothetical protein
MKGQRPFQSPEQMDGIEYGDVPIEQESNYGFSKGIYNSNDISKSITSDMKDLVETIESFEIPEYQERTNFENALRSIKNQKPTFNIYELCQNTTKRFKSILEKKTSPTKRQLATILVPLAGLVGALTYTAYYIASN